jgi:hypothetical protein
MKVFLSWSGERSRAIAEALKGWLPSVLQAVRPYFSPEDVSKGSRWSSEIAKELAASRVAILIVTPENQEAPWLLFEAGALSKNLDQSKVCPMLFGGMEPTDVKGPLVQFQAARFGEEEMRRVLKAINAELGESALPPDVLERVFKMWWPGLESQVSAVQVADKDRDGPPRRSERDLLEEVLARVRNLDSRGSNRPRRVVPDGAVLELLEVLIGLARIAVSSSSARENIALVTRLHAVLRYLMVRDYLGPVARFDDDDFRPLMNELRDLALMGPEIPVDLPQGADSETTLNNEF